MMSIWIVTENGLIGTENQALGIASALGVPPVVKRIGLKQPWKTLSPWLGFEHVGIFTGDSLQPPYPDVLITGGRKSIAVARFIKKESRGKTFCVHLLDPKINPKAFDLVVVPAHDSLRGENVVVTTGASNRVTDKVLTEAREKFAPLFEVLPSPRVAVLIGGSSNAYQMTEAVMRRLCVQLGALDAGLMVTASRRTGEENLRILKEFLSSSALPPPNLSPPRREGGNQKSGGRSSYLWDGAGDNPYFGLLAWADVILVTADSVSMLSEAASTGKPVYMIRLEGGKPRLNRFHQNLITHGAARWFEGSLETWSYTPLNDAALVAAEIKTHRQSTYI